MAQSRTVIDPALLARHGRPYRDKIGVPGGRVEARAVRAGARSAAHSPCSGISRGLRAKGVAADPDVAAFVSGLR